MDCLLALAPAPCSLATIDNSPTLTCTYLLLQVLSVRTQQWV